MDFSALGSMLINLGMTTIGTALGVPALAPVASGILKSALKLPDTASNDDIAAAATSADPQVRLAIEQTAQEKLKSATAIAQAQADVGKSQVEAVNASIQAETAATAAKPDGWWGNWRTVLAYELAAECPFWAALMMYEVAIDKAGIGDLVQASGLIMTWWGARFGLLGVHVWTGSNERQVAMTGAPAGGVAGGIGNLVKALTGKK